MCGLCVLWELQAKEIQVQELLPDKLQFTLGCTGRRYALPNVFGSSDIWSDTSWSLSWRLASWCSYNGRIIYSSYNGRIILLVVLLYVVPTEFTDNTEAYGLKLFESTEWPTLREARIHRNECLRRHRQQTMLNLGTLHKQSILWLLSYDAQRLYALWIPKP